MFLESAHPSHRRYMKRMVDIRDMETIKVGDIVQFTYKNEPRTVYVLNPEYKHRLHGLTMLSLDRRTLLNDIIRFFRVNESSQRFYERVVNKQSIISLDAYRTYDTDLISDIQQVIYEF